MEGPSDGEQKKWGKKMDGYVERKADEEGWTERKNSI